MERQELPTSSQHKSVRFMIFNDPDRCYTFQLVSRIHRFVVKYDEDIILIAARDLDTLLELDVQTVAVDHFKFKA